MKKKIFFDMTLKWPRFWIDAQIMEFVKKKKWKLKKFHPMGANQFCHTNLKWNEMKCFSLILPIDDDEKYSINEWMNELNK